MGKQRLYFSIYCSIFIDHVWMCFDAFKKYCSIILHVIVLLKHAFSLSKVTAEHIFINFSITVFFAYLHISWMKICVTCNTKVCPEHKVFYFWTTGCLKCQISFSKHHDFITLLSALYTISIQIYIFLIIVYFSSARTCSSIYMCVRIQTVYHMFIYVLWRILLNTYITLQYINKYIVTFFNIWKPVIPSVYIKQLSILIVNIPDNVFSLVLPLCVILSWHMGFSHCPLALM